MGDFTQQEMIAKRLLEFIQKCPNLPVDGGAFSIDGLRADGRQMSIHFSPGQVVKASLSGRKKIRQPFGISYRAAATDDDNAKSVMMGVINSIGRWLDSVDRRGLDLGPGINVQKLEQSTWAFIMEQAENQVAYMGDFVLEYDQRTITRPQ